MNISLSKKDIDKESQIKSMFDSIACRYDFLNKLLSLKSDVRWRKNLVNLLTAKKNGVYLDVATGTGDIAFQIKKKYGCQIIGLD